MSKRHKCSVCEPITINAANGRPFDRLHEVIRFSVDDDQVEPLAKEWANCDGCSYDDDGDIWIESPMRGHWLSADERECFAKWLEARS